MSYRECLDSLGLPTLYDRRNGLCRQLFNSIAINPGHKLYHLLPPRKQSSYNLRPQKLYNQATFPYGTFQTLFCLCYVPGLRIKLLKFQRSRLSCKIFIHIFWLYYTRYLYSYDCNQFYILTNVICKIRNSVLRLQSIYTINDLSYPILENSSSKSNWKSFNNILLSTCSTT